MSLKRILLSLMLTATALPTLAQQLDTQFSCSTKRDDHGLPTQYFDGGKIKVDGNKITEFWWESSLFRSTHGFDCSINTDDGMQAEFIGDEQHDKWRFSLQDAHAARTKRGYDFSHGYNCTIRVERSGDSVHITPSCPALCGSRQNFSELTVNTKTGECQYEE
jgi:hypothetical protein